MSPTTTTTLAQHWGSAIATQRKARHITQRQLSIICGVEQQTVSKWENGETTPRDANKVAIARALSTTVADLFAYPEAMA